MKEKKKPGRPAKKQDKTDSKQRKAKKQVTAPADTENQQEKQQMNQVQQNKPPEQQTKQLYLVVMMNQVKYPNQELYIKKYFDYSSWINAKEYADKFAKEQAETIVNNLTKLYEQDKNYYFKTLEYEPEPEI